MAHEITSSDRMAYAATGGVPWHGLGVSVTDEQGKDIEFFHQTVCPWEPFERPVYYKDDNGNLVEFPEYKGRFRSDSRVPLGIVGADHTAWGNYALFNWFRPFIEKDLMRFETGGTLRGGKLVWALAKINLQSDIVKGDAVQRYLQVSNGHGGNGGTHAIRIGFTDIRTVCKNTLLASYTDASSKLLRFRHTKNVLETVEEVRDVIDVANREFAANVDQYRKLAASSINHDDLRKYVKLVLGVTEEKEKVGLPTRTLNTIDKIIDLAISGVGSEIGGVKGTLWGAYNAITEYTTWQRGRSVDTRLNSLWFGNSAELNKVALETAISMAV